MGSFDNIIGYENIKNELYQIIDCFKNREAYEKLGAKIPHGVLLYGDPGMGKTLLAKDMIKECNVKSFILRKNKEKSKIFNDVRRIFEEASKCDKAVILVDDIDKFSEKSSRNGPVDDEAFVAIQTEIDIVRHKNILVIATANDINKLPYSLKRSGRFDIKIELKSPTFDDAKKIIEYYLKSKKVSNNVNYDDISKMISYSSCAELETVINQSALIAAYNRKEYIETIDIVKAYLKKEYMILNDNYKYKKDELETYAMHEAGHVTISEILKEGSIGFVCVQHSECAVFNGFTYKYGRMDNDKQRILYYLGGKAATELYLKGECDKGSNEDLSDAYNLIKEGISELGTCGIGTLEVCELSQTNLTILSSLTKSELERYLFTARDILIKNKELLFKIYEELKEKKILLASDIKRIRESCKIERRLYETI